MKTVKLFTPNTYTDEWIKELTKTFESGWLAQSAKVKEFEEQFCKEFRFGSLEDIAKGKKVDFGYALALNSCTAALEMALHLIGIGPGDHVLTPVLTCTATNIPLVHRGAHIEFVDIHKNTLTMDYDDLYDKIRGNTKAIVTVNLGGIECDERIYMLAQQKGIPVVVDAAQSLGIREPNGDYVCYSFQAIKHFTTGDGGMLVVRSQEEYERAKRLRWYGIDRDLRQKKNFDFSPSDREMCMNMDEPGFKTHMNDIQATMGIVGLRHYKEAMTHRNLIANTYERHLYNHVEYIHGGSNWLFCILLENRDMILDKLKSSGVECDLVHLRNDIFTPFGGKRQNLPNMNELESKYLYIPIHSKMDHTDATYVSEQILKLR